MNEHLNHEQLKLLVIISQQAARFYGYGTEHGRQALELVRWAREQMTKGNGKP